MRTHVWDSPATRPLCEHLESRLLLSAGADIALIDASVPDADALADAVGACRYVLEFDETQSPEELVDRISALSESSGEPIRSISVFSHGRPGAFHLGSEWFDSGDLEAAAAPIWSELAAAAAPDARLNLYGCHVGAGSQGTAVVDALSELTGMDVFASDDLTGRGGDWELEVSSGAGGAATAPRPDASALARWRYTLAIGEFDTSADIGDVGAAGSAVETGGTYTVEASGEDIWNASDEFHFVYKQVTGDFDAVVRVVSVEDTHSWAKAGLMIRNTLDADSSYVAGFVTPGNSAAHQHRNHQGAATSNDAGSGNYFPRWVRIVRDGDTFKTYDSADGASWDLIGDYAQPMVDTAYLGLAVTAHNDGALCTAELDSFDLGDTPVAVGEVYLGPVNQDIDEAAGALLANDTDPNDGPMTTVLDTDVSNGTLSLGDDGSFTYSPDVDFAGTDSFTYYVASGSFTSASVTVELDIYDDTNTAPVITAPAEEVCYGQAVWFGSQTASGITIDDEDSGSETMQLDLTVDLGTLSITDTAGASVISGDVNGDTSIVLQGSANDLNDALEQLWWTSADGQSADATLTIEADDLGNTGTGGDLTDQVTVTLRMESADTDLLAHWTFDDGSGLVAADSAGSYDATYNEVGTLSWIDGVDGGAAHLDGPGGQMFEAANADDMQPAALTVSAWVNFDVPFHQMDGAYPFLFNHESYSDKAGFSLGAVGNNDDLDLRVMDGSNRHSAVTYHYDAGEWLHVAATYDGTNLRIFIDGDLVATEEQAMVVHYVAGLPLDIGSNFEGALDDMRVYGRALRHDELIALANDAPTLAVNDGLTVDEDAAGTIDNTMLQVTDPEQGAGALTYTLQTDVTNGVLELDGAELSATDTFTQDDVDNNRLTYTHDGGETTADAFTFTVADGAGGSIAETTFAITVTPVNDAPTLAVNDGLTVDEDAAGTIDNTMLQVTDPEQGAGALTYTLQTDVTNGVLELDGAELSATDTFTQDDVDNNRLTYTHDGGETTADAFTFTVADGAGGSIAETTFAITVTPVNDAPSLVVSVPADVLQGAVTDLSASVGDVDSPAEVLTIQWSVLSGDGVILTSADSRAATATFTQTGEHVMRVTASDGQDETIQDATIQVAPIEGPDPADEEPDPLAPPSDDEENTDATDSPSHAQTKADYDAPVVSQTSDSGADASIQAPPPTTPPQAPQDERPAPEGEVPDGDGAPNENETPAETPEEIPAPQQQPGEPDEDVAGPTAEAPGQEPPTGADTGESTAAAAQTDDIPAHAAYLPPEVAFQRYGERYAHAAEAQWRTLELVHVWQAVDSADARMTERQAKSERIEAFAVGTAAGVSVAATVGYLAWTFRGASWVASILATCPPWVFVDPLPILDGKVKPRTPGKTGPDEDDTEKRVGSLLDR
ncbi:MAG: DUF4347 domain-containing protein [Phycisphaerae bacterium]|nr:DUF4347 domain-containing protein [Phycisphaerae bacterium]